MCRLKLRRRLGDERFTALLKDVCARYRFRPLSTEQFRSPKPRAEQLSLFG